MLNESIPTASARTASSMVLRTTTSPLSGCSDSSTVTKTGVSNPNSISSLFIASSSLRGEGPAACVLHGAFGRAVRSVESGPSRSAVGFEQLEVELDLHHVAERDRADTGRHRDVDAEVLAADLGRGLEASVAGPAREVLDASEFDGEDDGARDVADGQITVDLVFRSCARDPRGAE